MNNYSQSIRAIFGCFMALSVVASFADEAAKTVAPKEEAVIMTPKPS
jgi:hypothetical protein